MSILFSKLSEQTKFKYGDAWLLLWILIPGLYISDILFGILDTLGIKQAITPGQLSRGTVLIIAVFVTWKTRKSLGIILQIFLLASCALLAIASILSPKFPENILYDITPATKVIYGLFAAVLFRLIFDKYRVSGQQVIFAMELAFYLLGLSLLMMFFLDIGKPTYGDYAFGHKGIFLSQNDIGLSASITLAAALSSYYVNGGTIRLLLFIAATLGLACLGTRTGMFAPVVIAAASTAIFLINLAWGRSQRPKKSHVVWRAAVVLAACSTITLVTINSALLGEYQQKKLEGSIHRSELLRIGKLHIDSRTTFSYFFGEGSYSYRLGLAKYKEGVSTGNLITVEMDWFDLFGQYGLILCILIYTFYVYFLILCLYYFSLNRDFIWGTFSLMLGLYISHSVIAGHALVSPIPSTPIAAIIGYALSLRYRGSCKSGSKRQNR